MDFNSEDLARTLKDGHYQCPVCDKKIPSPLVNHKNSNPSSFFNQYRVAVMMVLALVIVSFMIYFFTSSEKTKPTVNAVAPADTQPVSPPLPAPASAQPAVAAIPEKTPAIPTAPMPQAPDKMKIVEQIAAEFHRSHSYTLAGEFVCLDMAINVWNQLMTRGIEAKIMGGNIRENITAWNFRQLAMESNHAWVLATISPREKVAVETTAGIVIKPGMKDYAAYFRGLEFDSPAEIKRFELLRKATYANCRATDQMINDWNENVADKQLRPEEVISRKSQIEQRKSDCDNAFRALKEFESKAIFY
ncbi:MAG: hypothetical protein WBN66_09615 [Smithella sp.]